MNAPSGKAFWGLTALGLAVAGFGLAGLLRNADETMPANWATFVIASLLAHDALWAPLVAVGSLFVADLLPRWLSPVVQVTLIVTAAEILVTGPALTGRGRLANNPSILPNDYAGNLALVVGLTWLACAAIAVVAWRRDRAGRVGV